MNYLLIFFGAIFCINSNSATTSENYLNRFNTYLNWSEQLPTTPNPAFIDFIQEKKPLSNKLREKWLYYLAQHNQWHDYQSYYQPSSDLSLQCYEQFALYEDGKQSEAIAASKSLWLTGNSLPPACDKLFSQLTKDNVFDQTLVMQRIRLALENRNFSLVIYLLGKLKDRSDLITLFNHIQQQPKKISELKSSPLMSDIYLYGIKRLLIKNIDQAHLLWQQAQSKGLLNEAQQQQLLTQIALQKAARNKNDAPSWFNRIKQAYVTEPILEWKLRFALKKHEWTKVEFLAQQSSNKESPMWQYWLGRSKEARGQKDNANSIYQKLANNRNYYGFLSSRRLKQPLQFQQESPITEQQLLLPYQSITQKIKTLYTTHQIAQASKLVNDFVSELPKPEKSALTHWLSSDLKWFGKAVYLSNTDEQLNHQLNLRFPLAYRDEVKQQSKHYQIPEALIYAIIRQESAFREDVVSFAGAHGLMQIMPTTATWIAKLHHINYTHKKQLFIFSKNIHLGAAYLHHLSKHYNQQFLLVVAAYNAGPTQVRAWLKAYPLQEADIWIENIPFSETRNYIKSVMSYYAVYQHQLKEPKPNLELFMKPYMG